MKGLFLDIVLSVYIDEVPDLAGKVVKHHGFEQA